MYVLKECIKRFFKISVSFSISYYNTFSGSLDSLQETNNNKCLHIFILLSSTKFKFSINLASSSVSYLYCFYKINLFYYFCCYACAIQELPNWFMCIWTKLPSDCVVFKFKFYVCLSMLWRNLIQFKVLGIVLRYNN